jgi:uncharacterized membrane protein YccC
MTNTNFRPAARRLARYRVALVALVALTVVLLTVVPAKLFGYGMDDPASVFFAVGTLVGWWVAFMATWVSWDRLRSCPAATKSAPGAHGDGGVVVSGVRPVLAVS